MRGSARQLSLFDAAVPVPAGQRRVPSYYATVPVSESQLQEYAAQAKGQEAAILAFFARHPGRHAPHQVRASVLPQAPITSVRRAITNLTKRQVLEKTSHLIDGPDGRPVHTWRLRNHG